MASALKGTTAAMVKMNKQMNLPAMQKIMMDFQSEEMKAEMTMEVILSLNFKVYQKKKRKRIISYCQHNHIARHLTYR